MTGLDPKTIMLMAGALGAVMSAVLFLLKRNYPPTIRGVELWAVSLAMSFVAGSLFSTTGLLPTFLSTTVPSLMVFFAPLVSLLGTRRFFGVSGRVYPWVLLTLLAAGASIWFTYVKPDYGVRLQLSSFVLTALGLAHIWLVWQKAGRTLAGRIALGVLVFGSGIQMMRFVTATLYPAGDNVLDASAQNVAYLAAFAFVIVLMAISQVLLATERLRRELEHAASHDSLTDAFTRRYMKDALQRELARCLRHNRHMSVLLLDIDHFKKVNDTLGHQEGDRVLTDLVSNIKALLRGADLLGRFGGEEFVVLLPETPSDVAQMVAERIRAAMSSWGGPTVSIGVTASIVAGDTVDALLARADTAMYRAKNKGRNRVEVA